MSTTLAISIAVILHLINHVLTCPNGKPGCENSLTYWVAVLVLTVQAYLHLVCQLWLLLYHGKKKLVYVQVVASII